MSFPSAVMSPLSSRKPARLSGLIVPVIVLAVGFAALPLARAADPYDANLESGSRRWNAS